MTKTYLSYYKLTGKWYADGEYETELFSFHEVIDEVRDMDKHPGLTTKWNGYILVNVKGLTHLIIPRGPIG